MCPQKINYSSAYNTHVYPPYTHPLLIYILTSDTNTSMSLLFNKKALGQEVCVARLVTVYPQLGLAIVIGVEAGKTVRRKGWGRTILK